MPSSPPCGWEPWRPGRAPTLPGLGPVVGHRGAALHAPENTLAGLRRAHALGARWVEFDVKLTGDGVPVLMHDETLDRTTGHRLAVSEIPLARLVGVDAGGRFDPAFAGEPVPTLTMVIDLLLELGLGANVEIKPCPGREVETAVAAMRLLLERWPASAPPILVSSFAPASLVAAREVAPGIPRGLLVDRVPRHWAHRMVELACTTLHPWWLPLRNGTLRHLVEQGVPVLVYTVNDGGRAVRLLRHGVRAVITDAPDRILERLQPAAA